MRHYVLLVIASLRGCAAFRAPPRHRLRAPLRRTSPLALRTSPLQRTSPLALRAARTADLSASITDAFPAWVAGAALVGGTPVGPAVFGWMGPDLVTAALALIMLAMGTTLTTADFARVAARPSAVLVGFCAQFGIMPAASVASSRLWGLPPALAAGVCLVGCCPGGTASNLVSLIARADVPLSISMTTASTLAAAALTPALASLCVGAKAAVSRSALAASTLKVVLLPVLGGLLLRRSFPGACDAAEPALAPAAVVLVALICGSVVAASAAAPLAAPLLLRLCGAVVTLHALGFALGYRAAALAGLPAAARRTVSIETGMQNSALAVVLAGSAGLPPAAALPGALSATAHSLIGSALARAWRRADRAPPRAAFARVAWSGPCYPGAD